MQCGYAISELLATDREEHEKNPCAKKMYQIFLQKKENISDSKWGMK